MIAEICFCNMREHMYDPENCPPNRRLMPLLEKTLITQKATGALAASLSRENPIAAWEVSLLPRGPHRLLCRIGLHAWQTRRTYRSGVLEAGHVHRSCAVCGRKSL